MTEYELTSEVVKLCAGLGLLYHHCPNSSRCQGPKGFPDLVIAGAHGLIFAELKSEDGETSAEQDLWAWTLRQPLSPMSPWGWMYELWRPADLATGLIRTLLESIK